MSLFNRLFPRYNNDSAVQEPGQANEVFEDLFIATEPPAAEERPKFLTSRLTELSSKDHTEEGSQAGYAYHNMDMCEQMLAGIRSKILKAVEDEIGQLGLFIDQLDVEISQLPEGLMENTLQGMKSRREQIRRHQLKLHEQKLLVTGNSGLADWPTTSFRTGFIRGYEDHLTANLLISKFLD